VTNLYSDIPASLPSEVLQNLLTAPSCRVARIISHGHASPLDAWYDEDEGEWILLVQGAARLQFENEAIELQPGDFVNIPAHKRHRVAWTTPGEPTIWLAVYYG